VAAALGLRLGGGTGSRRTTAAVSIGRSGNNLINCFPNCYCHLSKIIITLLFIFKFLEIELPYA
jgi:hypothetical protein